MISWPLVVEVIGATDSPSAGGLPLQRQKEVSHGCNKDSRFTDVASQYDRVEASNGKALYSAHLQCRWISGTSF